MTAAIILQAEERAILLGLKISLGKTVDPIAVGMTIKTVLSWVNEVRSDLDAEFRMQLIEAVLVANPKARAEILIATAKAAYQVKYPPVLEPEAVPSAVPSTPSKPAHKSSTKVTLRKGTKKKK